MINAVWTCVFTIAAFLIGLAAGWCIGSEAQEEKEMKQNMSIEEARRYAEYHKAQYENWKEGEIQEYWRDESGAACIRYESGKWFNYRENGIGEIVFW